MNTCNKCGTKMATSRMDGSVSVFCPVCKISPVLSNPEAVQLDSNLELKGSNNKIVWPFKLDINDTFIDAIGSLIDGPVCETEEKFDAHLIKILNRKNVELKKQLKDMCDKIETTHPFDEYGWCLWCSSGPFKHTDDCLKTKNRELLKEMEG